MARLRILIPEATTNYVKNPSARFDTSGWNTQGATLTRTLDYARFGISSLKAVTNGAALYEGINYRVNDLQNIGDIITASVYIRGAGIVRIRLIDNPRGQQWVSNTVDLFPDRWIRLEVTGRSSGSNDMRLYIETADRSAKAITFYADGAQMERKAYATTYCDGDQDGCRWNIYSHNSLSSRNAYTRKGGRWITIGGPEREVDDLYMTVVGGLGVAPLDNNIQSFALAPGSFYQNTKVKDRIVTITFYAKRVDMFHRCDPVTLAKLHQLRQLLIDLVKPDRTRGGEEFWIEYLDGDYPVYCKMRYDGGLEGEWDIRNDFVNSFPLRLLAVSPYLTEDNQNTATLTFQDSSILNGMAARVDGQWNRMNYGLYAAVSSDGGVEDLEKGSRGEIIAGGSFVQANYNAGAIDPTIPVNYITYWDGTKFNKLSTGANGIIYDVAVAPNGYIYATGAFTTIGGVAANRIAFWDGAAWNAMGTGLNGNGYHVVVAPLGYVYVGGTFTTAGGVNCARIARWNGTAWYTLGNYSGLNNDVRTIAVSQDGLFLYVGGAFTDENGNPGSGLNYVAQYNVSNGVFSAMGSGFNAIVREVVISSSNAIYACGDFTLSGADTINRIALWNGATWTPLGSGCNASVLSFDINTRGDLIAVGSFTQAGGVDTPGVALWNGSTWVNLDISVGVGKTGVSFTAVQFDVNNDIYLGGAGWSAFVYPSLFSGITIVTNSGTAEVSPVVYVLGPATLKWIENQTTGKRMFINLPIYSNEEITIDFGATTITSSVRGNLYYSILPGSDFHDFTLIPGDNKIAAFMVNDVGAKMQMRYVPMHWSADATQRGETF